MTLRPRPAPFALAVLLATTLGSTTVSAQDPEALLGRRVVTRTGVEVRDVFPGKNYQELVGPPEVELGTMSIGKITRVVGEWLELQDEDDSETRWVHEWEIVRFNDAHDYFTGQVKAHPQDATAYLERALFARRAGSRPELPGLPDRVAINDPFAPPFPFDPVPISGSAPTVDAGDPIAAAIELARDLARPTASDSNQAAPIMTRAARPPAAETPQLLLPEPFDPPQQGDPFFLGIARAFATRPVIDDLNEAIRLDPKLAYAYLLRGRAFDDAYKSDEAMADYSKCIQLVPNDTQAYKYRAELAFQLNRYEQAVADFSAVIQLDRSREDLYSWLGAARVMSRRYDDAIADLERALRSEPRNTTTIYYYGMAWAGKGEHDRAIAEFTRAIELEAKQADPQGDAYTFSARHVLGCKGRLRPGYRGLR